MERIDLTFYNNRFSIYRYIFSHMYNFYSKKPEYYNNDKKDDILRLFEKCDEIIELIENICNNKPIPHERYYNNFERFGDMLQLRNIYEELLEYFPSYKFIIFENISKRDVQKLKNELLYINVRFILVTRKRDVLLTSDDIKKI